MTGIQATISVSKEDLGNVWLTYRCETCSDTSEVDPTFFENSGTPICGNDSCEDEGGDMTVEQVHVSLIVRAER